MMGMMRDDEGTMDKPYPLLVVESPLGRLHLCLRPFEVHKSLRDTWR